MTARRSGRFAKVRLATGPRLHYAEFGDPDGQAILFLHGWPDSWFTFSRVLELLPEDFRALAIDQRGFGDSDRPEAGYSIPEMAADAIAFLDALDIHRATLVGHSFGSFVARLCDHRPSGTRRSARIDRHGFLGLESGHSRADDRDARSARPDSRAVREGLPGEHGVPPGAARFLRAHHRRESQAAAASLATRDDKLVEYDDTKRLARIEAPTHLLWGDKDAIFSRAEQDSFMAALPAARFTVYEETGHCPNWERPERVAADIAALVPR